MIEMQDYFFDFLVYVEYYSNKQLSVYIMFFWSVCLDYFVAVSQHEEPEPIVEDDEVEQELQMALQRSRRTALKKEKKEGTDEPQDEEDRLQKVCQLFINNCTRKW